MHLINNIAGSVERLCCAHKVCELGMLFLQKGSDFVDSLPRRASAHNFAVVVTTPQHKKNVAHLTLEVPLQTYPDLIRYKELARPGFHLISSLESPSVHEVALVAETISVLPVKWLTRTTLEGLSRVTRKSRGTLIQAWLSS